MGLFDQAIVTCKRYLKPVKQVKRKILVLEEQAKYARENDRINEEADFEAALNANEPTEASG